MKKADTIISRQKLTEASKSPTDDAAVREDADPKIREARIDAINQMFAELELAYHNQFHKAYASEGDLALAKKYWYSALDSWSPAVILLATRTVVKEEQFLPSLSTMVKACEEAGKLPSMLSARDAYREACLATTPKSTYAWSHPAVYFAGKACNWFELANRSEAAMLPLFEYHYGLLCGRVARGENLELPQAAALPALTEEALPSPEEQQKKLDALRKLLDS